MKLDFSLDAILNNIIATIKRFPLPLLCAFVFSLLSSYHILQDSRVDNIIFQIHIFLLFGFMATFIFTARYENQGNLNLNALLCSITLLLIGFWSFNLDLNAEPPNQIIQIFAMVGLSILGAAIIPYIGTTQGDSDDIWQWVFSNIISLIIAGLAAGILFAGIALILQSLDFLLGVDVPEELFLLFAIWSFAFLLPFFYLNNVPKEYDTGDAECNSAISFIIDKIATTLLLAYMVVLYLYFAKIIITWEMPSNRLAWLVPTFGFLGVLTNLAAYPLRDKGSILTRFFVRWFYPLLIIPIAMMLYGIIIRVSEYGITEIRYLVLAIAGWFIFLSLYYLITKRKDEIRTVLASAFILIIIGIFGGPLSMDNVSTYSQISRLEKELDASNLLDKNGKIIVSESSRNIDNYSEIQDSIRYFRRYDKEHELKRFIPPAHLFSGIDDVAGWKLRDYFYDLLNISDVSNEYLGSNGDYLRATRVVFNNESVGYCNGYSSCNNVLDVSDSQYIFPINISAYDTNSKDVMLKNEIIFSYYKKGNILYVMHKKYGDVQFDLNNLADRLINEHVKIEDLRKVKYGDTNKSDIKMEIVDYKEVALLLGQLNVTLNFGSKDSKELKEVTRIDGGGYLLIK